MLRSITDHIFDREVVVQAVNNYSSDPNDLVALIDRIDVTPLNPTYNIQTNTIDIFYLPGTRRFGLDITLLLPTSSMADIQLEFHAHNIKHGHVFATNKTDHIFYSTILELIPSEHADKMVSWKRCGIGALDRSLPGRRVIWDDLWKTMFRYHTSIHPLFFSIQMNYKGPIPLFSQTCYAYLLGLIGGPAIDIFIDQFVACHWLMPGAKFSRLWHEIMHQSAIAYLPPPVENHERYTQFGKLWLQLDDKLLILLLLLFHANYRDRLKNLNEPIPIFLLAIFTRFPQL